MYIAPTFHVYGPHNLMESILGVREPELREDALDRMLHLDDGARVRMGRVCLKHFKVLYGILPCLAPTKILGLALGWSEGKKRRVKSSSAKRSWRSQMPNF